MILTPILRRSFARVEGGCIWVLDHFNRYHERSWRRYESEEFEVPLTYCEGPLAECCKGLQQLRDSCPATENVYVYWEPRGVTTDAYAIERLPGGQGSKNADAGGPPLRSGQVRFGVRWCLVSCELPTHPFGAQAQTCETWTVRTALRGPLASFEFVLRQYYERALRGLDERLALEEVPSAGPPTGVRYGE